MGREIAAPEVLIDIRSPVDGPVKANSIQWWRWRGDLLVFDSRASLQ